MKLNLREEFREKIKKLGELGKEKGDIFKEVLNPSSLEQFKKACEAIGGKFSYERREIKIPTDDVFEEETIVETRASCIIPSDIIALGGIRIEVGKDGSIEVKPLPYTSMVSVALLRHIKPEEIPTIRLSMSPHELKNRIIVSPTRSTIELPDREVSCILDGKEIKVEYMPDKKEVRISAED